MGEPIYALPVEDFSCPAFCSFSTYYLGTLQDVRKLIGGIKESKLCKDLTTALQSFEAGETNVKYPVLYWDMQFLKEVVVYQKENLKIAKLDCTCKNIYECSYNLRGTDFETEMIWVKYPYEESEGKFLDVYARFAKYSAKDMMLENLKITDTICEGFPNLITTSEGRTVSNMFLLQRIFEDEEQLKADKEHFTFNEETDLHTFLLAIVGDG